MVDFQLQRYYNCVYFKSHEELIIVLLVVSPINCSTYALCCNSVKILKLILDGYHHKTFICVFVGGFVRSHKPVIFSQQLWSKLMVPCFWQVQRTPAPTTLHGAIRRPHNSPLEGLAGPCDPTSGCVKPRRRSQRVCLVVSPGPTKGPRARLPCSHSNL